MARAVRSKGRTSGDWTRSRILACASALFAEHGYAGTSVRMVARSVGLSDPAVHYYFPTKLMLYNALLQQPDYGRLPLDGRPITRPFIIDQVMHLFGWWIDHAEFGQMLLREQLTSDTASVEFMSEAENLWAANVTAPLRTFFGVKGEPIAALLFNLLAGVYWDAILAYGGATHVTACQPYFQQRVRGMVEFAIPSHGPTRP